MLPTCRVHCAVFDNDGSPVAGAVVTAKLDRFEVYQGYVVPDIETATTDETGACTLALWPNALGATASSYAVKIVAPNGRTQRLTVTVPNVADANLHEIAGLPPYEGKPDGQLAIEAAVAAVATATDAKLAAEWHATQAGISATEADNSATEASTSATLAASSASSAALSATNASNSATAAATSAAAAAASASSASGSVTLVATQATNASASASQAATSATQASAHADIAAQKAADAGTAAGLADQHRIAAESAATTATAAAQTATTQAQSAEGSATAAASARDAAQAAQASAEAAQADVANNAAAAAAAKDLAVQLANDAAAVAPVQSVAGKTGAVTLAKGDVGLGNVDNTSDANKPVSTAQQTALNGKENTGTAAAVVAAHEAAGDPHPQYQVDLVSGTNIKTINGQSILGAGNIEIQGGVGVALSGDANIYVTQSKTYTITNYNSFSEYVVQVSAGSVSLAGDTITFTAPATAGAVTLTVTMDGVPQAFAIDVQAATVLAPTITSPANGATGVIETPTFSTAAFQTVGLADTHLDSDWELWTGANRTGTLLWSSLADAANKLNITLPAGVTSVSTTFYLDVRHRGATLGASAWSEVSFTTAATFNSYIATPSPTPANFGDAFEGGFYAGLYWDQIAQSSSSKTLATGAQSFTVPDMTGAPIVYAGQTLEVRSRANPANKFIGTVTGATGTTLTLNVTSIGGSGTFSDWSVMSRFRAIFAPKSSGEHAGIALKNANTAFPTGCQSLVDGWTATEAMKNADTSTVYPAAHWARGLSINGYTDWHIPARDVLELAWRNLKPVTNNNYVTADRPTAQSFDYKRDGAYGDTANTHGTNNNSAPTGSAYTASVPAQTAATAFKTGGAEAFEFGSAYYWSSTEYNASSAWYQYWGSSHPGYQGSADRTNSFRVRASRRSII